MIEHAARYLAALEGILARIDHGEIAALGELLWEAYLADRLILICGNGGSAATAAHMACDLQKGTRPAPGRRFRALALIDNAPLVTAWANDEAYEAALARQVESLAAPGDLVIGISASGRSPNILRALSAARERGAKTAGLTGRGGAPLRALCDVCCTVPSEDVEKLEDAHAVIMHVVVSGLRARIDAGGV
ncbi:MAG TPA: SIS domain-containing protein [Limnochordia bacterium]